MTTTALLEKLDKPVAYDCRAPNTDRYINRAEEYFEPQGWTSYQPLFALTPSDIEAIKAALVEREELRKAIPKVRETLIAINRRGGLGFGVHDNLEACIAALGKDKS